VRDPRIPPQDTITSIALFTRLPPTNTPDTILPITITIITEGGVGAGGVRFRGIPKVAETKKY
jgi:hypothetical protein